MHLKGLTNLEELYLNDTQVSAAGKAQLLHHSLVPPPLLPPVRVWLLATRCAPASGHKACVNFLGFYTPSLHAVGFILLPSGHANRRGCT